MGLNQLRSYMGLKFEPISIYPVHCQTCGKNITDEGGYVTKDDREW